MNVRGMHVSHTHIRLLSDSSVSGEVQNLVGIHPSANTVKSEDIEGAAFEPVFILSFKQLMAASRK